MFRYDYLWTREAAAGYEQGKERPACLVVASDPLTLPRFVVILPITYSPPSGSDVAVEMPVKFKTAIGLDDARSWIVVSDFNVDRWPNAGLAPVPGHEMAFSYGFIPPGLFKQVKDAFVATHEAKRARGSRRR